MEKNTELCYCFGNSNNGANAGLAYANSNNAWSNTNSNRGSRLTYLIAAVRQSKETLTDEFFKPWGVTQSYTSENQKTYAERPTILAWAASSASSFGKSSGQ